MQICSAIRPAIGPAITSALVPAFCGSKRVRSFADTVAAWYDTGAPGRFVPTYRDWATSGALFQDMSGTRVTALEQFVAVNLDRSRNLALGVERWTAPTLAGGWAANGDGSYTKLAGTGNGNLSQSGLTVGRAYRMEFTIVSQTNSQGARSIMGGSTTGPWGVVGRYTIDLIAIGGVVAYLNSGGGGDVTVRDVSLREIQGSAHRIQPTTTARPILTARKNRFDNSAWLGGGALPTSWTQPGANGITTPLAPVNANTPYRFTAAAQRPFFAAPNVTLAVGQSATVSVEVAEVATGSETLVGAAILALGTGTGTITVAVDGVTVPNNTQLSTVAGGSRISATLVCTAAGTFQPRTGMGASTNATGSVVLVNPMLTLGGSDQIGRYQRTSLTATVPADYDAVGFPVGLRTDGIDDGSYTSTNINLSGTPFLSIAGAWRPDLSTGTQLLIESSPVYSTNDGAIEVSLNEISAGGLTFSRRTGGTVQYRHQGFGQTTPRNAGLTGRTNSTLPALADVDFKVNGVLGPLTGGSPNSAPTMGDYVWSYGRRIGGGLYYTGMEYGDLAIGQYRSDAEMEYVNAQFALNLSEALA